MRRPRLLPLVALMAICTGLCAQYKPVELPSYKFINYNANTLHYDTASPYMKHFFEKWQSLSATGTGSMNIVHIGGSHVQAGKLSNTIRCNILAAEPGRVGPRGMIFPYSAAAKCNNPADYRVHCFEKMKLTRNVYKSYDYPLGLCGIAVTACDTITEIQLVLNEPSVDYAVSRVVLIGRSDQSVIPLLRYNERDIYPSYVDGMTDRFVFNLSREVDSFAVVLPCEQGESFTVNGIYLDNRRDGFSLSSIGVNGAAVPDYLRCENFARDLRLLHPDVVVFGIGINDAVPANFDTAAFRSNYLLLVDQVRQVNPDCAFIFVTNNDSYRKTGRRHYAVNTNGSMAREVFYRLAEETGGAVWDQFEVMGGLKSMDLWRQEGLAQYDRVHFTPAGYKLVGDLFSNALFDALNRYSHK